MKQSQPNILVLGIDGMLGDGVFRYLSSVYPGNVFGTSRSKVDRVRVYFLQVETVIEDLTNIVTSLQHIDYIINCIGVLRSSKNQNAMQSVNAEFPHTLVHFTERVNCQLIHVSTDAVFSARQTNASEDTRADPEDFYGKTKLNGEPNSMTGLTIRTSLIGFDRISHKGLLEQVLKSTGVVKGYIHAMWSGSTVIQFAIFCEKIIRRGAFKNLRNHSPVFHFAPIGTVSKYQLIKEFIQILGIQCSVKEYNGQSLQRTLKTNFPKEIWLSEFKSTSIDALHELVTFEYRQ